MNILLIDNNDSFTFNLEHLLVKVTGDKPVVVSYNDIAGHDTGPYDLTVISPGPKRPSDYPEYGRVFQQGIPILGICLGMQIINEQFGGTTAPLAGCYHGRAEEIPFGGTLFKVARYHSLYAATVGENLEVFAINTGGIPMALRHEFQPIVGYQFHPESFLTTSGEYFIEYALCHITGVRNRSILVDRIGA